MTEKSLWSEAVRRAPAKVRPKIQLARALPAAQGLELLAKAREAVPDDPAIAAENTEFICYLCPNKDSYPLLPAEIRDNPGIFLKPEIRARSEMIADIGAANALYVRVWDRLKSAR
jgi:spermidine/putrescine-binding protein